MNNGQINKSNIDKWILTKHGNWYVQMDKKYIYLNNKHMG